MAKPSSLFLGRLEREYLINPQGQVFIDQPGGNLLYAAAGFQLWEKKAGLLSRVGVDYPMDWLRDFERSGFEVRGVRKINEDIDQRTFTAYSDLEKIHHDQPISHFARLGLPFPKSLLGYERRPQSLDSLKKRPPLSLRDNDLPENYTGVEAAHLCSLDFFSHSLMPPALREKGTSTITMDAGAGYMHPDFWNELPNMLSGLSAYLIKEAELRIVFSGRSDDIWEMAEMLASFNCRAIVIKRESRGALLYDRDGQKHYRLPAYPSQARDLTGASSSFSGGFLAGLQESGDFLRACAYGGATQSLASEGSGAFYVLDSLKGLAESRMESLSQAAQSL